MRGNKGKGDGRGGLRFGTPKRARQHHRLKKDKEESNRAGHMSQALTTPLHHSILGVISGKSHRGLLVLPGEQEQAHTNAQQMTKGRVRGERGRETNNRAKENPSKDEERWRDHRKEKRKKKRAPPTSCWTSPSPPSSLRCSANRARNSRTGTTSPLSSVWHATGSDRAQERSQAKGGKAAAAKTTTKINRNETRKGAAT